VLQCVVQCVAAPHRHHSHVGGVTAAEVCCRLSQCVAECVAVCVAVCIAVCVAACCHVALVLFVAGVMAARYVVGCCSAFSVRCSVCCSVCCVLQSVLQCVVQCVAVPRQLRLLCCWWRYSC